MSKIAPQQSLPGSEPGANLWRQDRGGVSGSGAARGVSHAATKPVSKPTLSHTARFTSAAGSMAEEKAGPKGIGSVPVVLLVTGVSLALLMLGVFMVYIGDEKFIVDVIVLGAICIVMGLASFILGMILVLKPLYRKRKHQEEDEQAAAKEDPSVEDGNSFSMPSRPPFPSTSREDPQPGPGRRAESGGQGQHDPASARGKLRTPSPPLEAGSGQEGGRTSEEGSTLFSSSADEAEAGPEVLKQKLEDDIRALL